MPEALWFLFWCCVHTSAYVELGSLEFEVALVDLLEPRPRHTPNASLRDWRVHCRNTHQVGAGDGEHPHLRPSDWAWGNPRSDRKGRQSRFFLRLAAALG